MTTIQYLFTTSDYGLGFANILGKITPMLAAIFEGLSGPAASLLAFPVTTALLLVPTTTFVKVLFVVHLFSLQLHTAFKDIVPILEKIGPVVEKIGPLMEQTGFLMEKIFKGSRGLLRGFSPSLSLLRFSWFRQAPPRESLLP